LNRIRLKDYLLFNRNILIAFTAAFLTSAVTSQGIVGFTSSLINSLVSLVADVSVFLTIFSILFYRDNKHRLVNEHTQKGECGKIKWVIIKVASTRSVAEIEYNVVKPSIHFWLLTIHYEPFVASTIASFIAIIGYIAVADCRHILHVYLKRYNEQYDALSLSLGTIHSSINGDNSFLDEKLEHLRSIDGLAIKFSHFYHTTDLLPP
jgi:hypothetical protein